MPISVIATSKQYIDPASLENPGSAPGEVYIITYYVYTYDQLLFIFKIHGQP